MKLLFLSGAYKNAGDYLILERCQNIVKHILKDCEIETVMANEPLQDKLDYVNSFDWIVFPGGPGYLYNYYPDYVKLTNNLEDIKPKMMGIGMGWYGIDTSGDTIYDYSFSDDTKKLLNRIQRDSGFLGCRDNYSVRVLKNSGYDTGIMTGCPAWYDVQNIDKLTLRDDIDYSFKKICVSDPANIYENSNQCLSLLKYLKEKYPNSEINFVFHRGLKSDNFTDSFTGKLTYKLKTDIEALGINVTDIAYSSEGFKIYDDADFHIGFRVHAHIYNLSKRNISLLIEEDGRGAGVNEALGLYSLPAYSKKKKYNRSIIVRGYRKLSKMAGFGKVETPNKYLIKTIDDYIYLLSSTDFKLYKEVFFKMHNSYELMEEKIKIMDR